MKNNPRAKVTKVIIEVEYSDGVSKLIDIDPNEYEAVFWSDKAVTEILAPFYEGGKPVPTDEIDEVAKDVGREVNSITPEIVMGMWNSPNSLTKNDADFPAMIKKKRKCIPTPKKCRYGC